MPSDADDARAIDAACRDWGFFQIVGHGIDDAPVRRAAPRRCARSSRSRSRPSARSSRTAENPWGFYDRELTQHTRDWKQIYDYGPARRRGHRAAVAARSCRRSGPSIASFYAACDALALRLLRVIAAQSRHAAGCSGRRFRPQHTSFLRLNYYPPCPTPERPTDCRAAAISA